MEWFCLVLALVSSSAAVAWYARVTHKNRQCGKALRGYLDLYIPQDKAGHVRLAFRKSRHSLLGQHIEPVLGEGISVEGAGRTEEEATYYLLRNLFSLYRERRHNLRQALQAFEIEKLRADRLAEKCRDVRMDLEVMGGKCVRLMALRREDRTQIDKLTAERDSLKHTLEIHVGLTNEAQAGHRKSRDAAYAAWCRLNATFGNLVSTTTTETMETATSATPKTYKGHVCPRNG